MPECKTVIRKELAINYIDWSPVSIQEVFGFDTPYTIGGRLGWVPAGGLGVWCHGSGSGVGGALRGARRGSGWVGGRCLSGGLSGTSRF